MLAANRISKSFHLDTILNEISFSIAPGERVGLIGPNGSGKTTLLRILAGELAPDTGHDALTPSNLRLGYLPQGFAFDPGASMVEILHRQSGDMALLEAELMIAATALAKQPDEPD
ncbi:MAG: ATP-binding cassette domain-containing protein [Chloroflexota bacterium]|jgi:ATP-binding cassette, subfamily F, member 3